MDPHPGLTPRGGERRPRGEKEPMTQIAVEKDGERRRDARIPTLPKEADTAPEGPMTPQTVHIHTSTVSSVTR